MKTFSLFNNGVWMISAYRNINTGNASLKVENLKTGYVDWPIQYDDGRVAYDFPERLPIYVKRKVQSICAPSNNQWASLIDVEKAGVI